MAGEHRSAMATTDVALVLRALCEERVLATDRASVADFQAFCRETGHALVAWSEENGVFSFVIRRRAEPPEQKG